MGTILLWADWVTGEQVNILPQRPGDEGKLVQDIIVKLTPEVTKWLGIDMNLEGVDDYGKPGGIFVKVEVDPEKMLPPQEFANGERIGRYIAANFNRTECVWDQYYNGLGENVKRLEIRNNNLKAMLDQMVEENKLLANKVEAILKLRSELLVAAALDETSNKTEDEEGIDKSSE